MRRAVVLALVLTVGFVFGMIGDRALNAQQPAVLKRAVLLQHDVNGFAGREVTMVSLEVPLAAQTGWHHHPGEEYSYVLEGEGVMEVKGQAPIPLKAGSVVHNDEGVVHNAKNTSTAPFKLVTFYVVEKGKPLAVPDQPPQ
jgi:quercetin dioxygenase-like cupin family protein